MIARLHALTDLEFDIARVQAATKPNLDGEVYDSAKGWIVDQTFPHSRVILSADAIDHGVFMNTRNPDEEHVNERVHWSVIGKRGRKCTVFGVPDTPYAPGNLPASIEPAKIAAITPEEQALLPARPA
jgi:hypothetical protein